MSTPVQKVYRYCRGDGSLTIAVVILIVFVFVLYPMVEVHVISRVWLDLASCLFLAFGAAFVFEPQPIVRLFLVALACTVTFSVIDHFFDHPWLFAMSAVATMIACVLLGWLLLVRVMRDGRINVNRIMGAVGSYLLIGVVFAQMYRLLAYSIDGAFAVGGTPADFDAIYNLLSYFSFITLTSTGYGDITPLHPYARSLATLEALSGNLFLTVLVARLVGLEMGWREEQRERRRTDDDDTPPANT
jgi:hypothetical protein